MVAELRPHVTLVDVNLGGECGFDLAEQLHRRQRVVILISGYAEDDFSVLISESPAVGFLTKSELSSSAIRRMLDGTRGADLRSQVPRRIPRPSRGPRV
jgi:FixJ family two-component response regulator